MARSSGIKRRDRRRHGREREGINEGVKDGEEKGDGRSFSRRKKDVTVTEKECASLPRLSDPSRSYVIIIIIMWVFSSLLR